MKLDYKELKYHHPTNYGIFGNATTGFCRSVYIAFSVGHSYTDNMEDMNEIRYSASTKNEFNLFLDNSLQHKKPVSVFFGSSVDIVETPRGESRYLGIYLPVSKNGTEYVLKKLLEPSKEDLE
jgi:hypothetical protein